MKWFKHMTCSGTDEKLAIIIDELGLEGYGFYWRLLEIVAEKLDAKGEPNCCYSIKRWSKIFGLYPKKFLKILERFEKLSLIFCKTFEKHSEKFSETSEKILEISIPNLLKYRDNYTKNSQVADNKVASIEIDKDKDINIIKSSQNPGDFDEQKKQPVEQEISMEQGELVPQRKKGILPCPQQKILSLYAEILPELPQVQELRANVQRDVSARWKEKCKKRQWATEQDGLEYFKQFFTYVSYNNWLMGRAEGNNGWVCDYRWLMRASNFDAVTSGKYARHQQ